MHFAIKKYGCARELRVKTVAFCEVGQVSFSVIRKLLYSKQVVMHELKSGAMPPFDIRILQHCWIFFYLT